MEYISDIKREVIISAYIGEGSLEKWNIIYRYKYRYIEIWRYRHMKDLQSRLKIYLQVRHARVQKGWSEHWRAWGSSPKVKRSGAHCTVTAPCEYRWGSQKVCLGSLEMDIQTRWQRLEWLPKPEVGLSSFPFDFNLARSLMLSAHPDPGWQFPLQQAITQATPRTVLNQSARHFLFKLTQQLVP